MTTLNNMIPIKMKPMSKKPGPPEERAPPEPMNRPVPIEPPKAIIYIEKKERKRGGRGEGEKGRKSQTTSLLGGPTILQREQETKKLTCICLPVKLRF